MDLTVVACKRDVILAKTLPVIGFSKGGDAMVEELEKLAVERAELFQRTSLLLAGEELGLAVVEDDSRNFVRFLSFMWNVVQGRLCQ